MADPPTVSQSDPHTLGNLANDISNRRLSDKGPINEAYFQGKLTEDVIFAREKWTPESEAAGFTLTDDYKVTEEAKRLGLKYFLELRVARDVLDALMLTLSVTKN